MILITSLFYIKKQKLRGCCNMLDQNTDRSWWMIGAVVVGAALVGVVSVAFPDLTHSVINVFTDKLSSVK
ncbi:hypothetical protein BAN44_5643 [Bacillus anthracis]|uniref:Uncharacterized protein n=1 Tax=Bacillus anthracis TaxID=1392 RepID=Q6F053_BACAN|nr:hypothetical protein BX_B0025 [Bacillus anthracis str. A2012]AAT28955.2 hypothetical protein GBAA_pXO2_0025 [Bacillus anthracis str. 'Ames Ancestor']ADK08270.1 hypothetical protein BACI_pCIXO200250 [Bacillus cereus biovar anthracis str. CI]GAO62688.1 hypothetical protein BAN44_5643 [Bacillus anthracis]